VTVAPGAQPPVPALLGKEAVTQAGGIWTVTQYGGRVAWRYVPPGEYRDAKTGTTVRLTVGFWAMAEPLRPDRIDYDLQVFLNGCGINDKTPQDEGMLSLPQEVALRLADPLLPVRLPTVAEVIATVHIFGPPKTYDHHWAADAWPAGRQTAVDPWGAWDRLGLGEVRDGALPLLEAVPAPVDAGGLVGVGFIWHNRPRTESDPHDLRISVGGFASPALLVAPAW
jgi:hypothetical protein